MRVFRRAREPWAKNSLRWHLGRRRLKTEMVIKEGCPSPSLKHPHARARDLLPRETRPSPLSPPPTVRMGKPPRWSLNPTEQHWFRRYVLEEETVLDSQGY